MRFYDVERPARFASNGVDVREMRSRGPARELSAMVLQDTWLFKGSVRENIRYCSIDAADATMVEAARPRGACADHFIRTLPGATTSS
ncbi:MAG: hypothetical protein ACLTSX_00445 [Collinsella sp.]